MSTIKIYLNDWMYNAGVLGLYRVLAHSNGREHILRNSNYIEFDSALLENFGEKYFKYFIDEYEKFTSWYRITSFQSYLYNINMEEMDEEKLEYINKQIEYTKERLKSASYKSAYEAINGEVDLLKKEKELKKINKKKKEEISCILPQLQNEIENLNVIISYLKREEVKKIIAGKNVIYDVIDKFLKDVSFLNKNANKNSMYDEYNTYFLNGIEEYIESDKEKYKYSCFVCDGPISQLSKPASYDLTWLNKMGVDMSRKTSHFWDFNGDSYICPICNIIYSCIPAGFNVLKGRGLFINDNSSIDRLVKINNLSIKDNDNMELMENLTYYRIIESMSQDNIESINQEIDNIQVVKLDTENVNRPYTFNILSKNMLSIISNHKESLRKLIDININLGTTKNAYWINLHKEVIRRLYNNVNQFDLIHKLLILSIEDKFYKTFAIKLIMNINNDFIGILEKNKGGTKMSKKGVLYTQDLGYKLRSIYNKKAENKVNGITYRLMNALRTKNVDKFTENIINAYMYVGEQIPTIFLEALKDEDKFKVIGYAFVLGLQGEGSKLQQIKESNINED